MGGRWRAVLLGSLCAVCVASPVNVAGGDSVVLAASGGEGVAPGTVLASTGPLDVATIESSDVAKQKAGGVVEATAAKIVDDKASEVAQHVEAAEPQPEVIAAEPQPEVIAAKPQPEVIAAEPQPEVIAASTKEADTEPLPGSVAALPLQDAGKGIDVGKPSSEVGRKDVEGDAITVTGITAQQTDAATSGGSPASGDSIMETASDTTGIVDPVARKPVDDSKAVEADNATAASEVEATKLSSTSKTDEERNAKTLACERNKGHWMIGVVTSPNHFAARDAMRRTIQKTASSLGIDFKFFIGELGAEVNDRSTLDAKINSEVKTMGDVVRLSGFHESYHSLSFKALGIFRYALDNCYDGVMKIDDDVFLDVPRIRQIITDQVSDMKYTYAGHMHENANVEKNPDGRWYAYDQFPHDVWPTYADGPGIFLGSNLLKYISENEQCLTGIRIDDAAVGVCLAECDEKEVVHLMVDSYRPYTRQNSVYISPVFPEEYDGLHLLSTELGDRSGFELKTCQQGQPTACLCGAPFTQEETNECWRRVSSTNYQDVIPRDTITPHYYIQTSTKVEEAEETAEKTHYEPSIWELLGGEMAGEGLVSLIQSDEGAAKAPSSDCRGNAGRCA